MFKENREMDTSDIKTDIADVNTWTRASEILWSW